MVLTKLDTPQENRDYQQNQTKEILPKSQKAAELLSSFESWREKPYRTTDLTIFSSGRPLSSPLMIAAAFVTNRLYSIRLLERTLGSQNKRGGSAT